MGYSFLAELRALDLSYNPASKVWRRHLARVAAQLRCVRVDCVPRRGDAAAVTLEALVAVGRADQAVAGDDSDSSLGGIHAAGPMQAVTVREAAAA